MQTELEKNLRTAAAVGVWTAMLALSQESAATNDPKREDFARYTDWRAHLMATGTCGTSTPPQSRRLRAFIDVLGCPALVQRSQRGW